jgi:hypothetical protein
MSDEFRPFDPEREEPQSDGWAIQKANEMLERGVVESVTDVHWENRPTRLRFLAWPGKLTDVNDLFGPA